MAKVEEDLQVSLLGIASRFSSLRSALLHYVLIMAGVGQCMSDGLSGLENNL